MNTASKLHQVPGWRGRHLRPVLGIYEDEWGGKLLHIAWMRSSNGRGYVSHDIPIEVREEDGVVVEPGSERHQL